MKWSSEKDRTKESGMRNSRSWRKMRMMPIWRVVSLAFLRWVVKDWGWKLHMVCESDNREVRRVAGDMPSQG